MTQSRHPERLRAFIGALAELIDGNPREGDLLHRGGKLLAQLVSHDDWLPDEIRRMFADWRLQEQIDQYSLALASQ